MLCLEKGLGSYNKFVKTLLLAVFKIMPDLCKLQIQPFLVSTLTPVFSITCHIYESFILAKMLCSLSSVMD